MKKTLNVIKNKINERGQIFLFQIQKMNFIKTMNFIRNNVYNMVM